jgi:polyribonucleotide nucleotidyltransferase
MSEALEQARQARLSILRRSAVILAPRPDLKPHAPRITIIKVPVDKSSPSSARWQMIRAIQEETDTKFDQ